MIKFIKSRGKKRINPNAFAEPVMEPIHLPARNDKDIDVYCEPERDKRNFPREYRNKFMQRCRVTSKSTKSEGLFWLVGNKGGLRAIHATKDIELAKRGYEKIKRIMEMAG